MTPEELREKLLAQIERYEFTDSGELADEIMTLFQAERDAAVAAADKHPSTVRGYQLGYKAGVEESKPVHQIELVKARIQTAERIIHKGFVIPDMEVQLEDEVNRLKQELARLQPPKATDQTEISLCPTCMSMTHTHDGICTRCGELKADKPESGDA